MLLKVQMVNEFDLSRKPCIQGFKVEMKEMGKISRGHQQYVIKQSFQSFVSYTQSFYCIPHWDYHEPYQAYCTPNWDPITNLIKEQL